MVISVMRHLHRSKLYATGVDCCSRKFHRISSLQTNVLKSNVVERNGIGKDAIGLSCCLRKFHRISSLQTKVSSLQNSESKNPMDYQDYFNVTDLVNLKELFDARVHLGHHEGAWNRLTRPYIYGLRATQHIIDLNHTVECLKCALNVLSHIVYKQGIVCFMSTNPRYDYLIQKTARSSGEYFITREWQRGLFANSNKQLGTDRLPDLVIAFNISRFERIREAITEVTMCNIPVIGIVDTDCDPRLITYPVPGNDDSMDSVTKLCDIFKKAITNAKERREIDEAENDNNESRKQRIKTS